MFSIWCGLISKFGNIGSKESPVKSICLILWSMLLKPKLLIKYAYKYCSFSAVDEEIRAATPFLLFLFCSVIKTLLKASIASSHVASSRAPFLRSMGTVSRSSLYMPSNAKRSRSDIQTSLISGFSLGTIRLILSPLTCKNMFEPTQSWGETLSI